MIVDQQIEELERHIENRLWSRAFELDMSESGAGVAVGERDQRGIWRAGAEADYFAEPDAAAGGDGGEWRDRAGSRGAGDGRGWGDYNSP